MSPAIIIAIGVALIAALVAALLIARRSGEALGAKPAYGHELDAPAARRRRPATARGAAILACILVALGAMGAGFYVALGNGQH